MTDDELPDPARRALENHDAFEADADGWACTTTPLSVTVTATPAPGDREAAFEVEVRMPTLDAVVTGETVADVVEDGWFETLERRLDDAFDVASTGDADDPRVEREDRTATATLSFRSWSADEGVDDAKAVIDYVEGTYVQGAIPGYDYEDPLARLLHRARTTGEGAGDDEPERGGTPL